MDVNQFSLFGDFSRKISEKAVSIGSRITEMIQGVTPVERASISNLDEGHVPGELQRSLHPVIEQIPHGVSIQISSETPQAKYLKYGTPAHPIPLTPKVGGKLRWDTTSDGVFHWASQVINPGMPANDYPKLVDDQIKSYIRDQIDGAIND